MIDFLIDRYDQMDEDIQKQVLQQYIAGELLSKGAGALGAQFRND
ncbi:hypothetical protein SDC9_196200 [bioreactor metagenome]|uniref:Uncharacterized protein n=1 Tax=bioreactor metagenome TaxID=1076179 RepID=A0A645IBS5_9ZZZZ